MSPGRVTCRISRTDVGAGFVLDVGAPFDLREQWPGAEPVNPLATTAGWFAHPRRARRHGPVRHPAGGRRSEVA